MTPTEYTAGQALSTARWRPDVTNASLAYQISLCYKLSRCYGTFRERMLKNVERRRQIEAQRMYNEGHRAKIVERNVENMERREGSQ